MEKMDIGIGSRVRHPEYGDGVVIQVYANAWEITFMEHGTRRILRSFEGLEVLDLEEPDTDIISYAQVERMFRKVMTEYTDITEVVPLGDKWINGKLILEPGRRELQSKEMPIDVFFHKIVMIRDRVRVMEQKINASELSDEDKVNLQQYISRIYGSLTSFNILFAEKEHHFRGGK